MAKCIECGADFEAQRSTAKFCSTNCRVKWNKKGGIEESETKEEKLENVPRETIAISKPQMIVKSNGDLSLAPSQDKVKAMEAAVAKINKDFGEGTIIQLGQKPKHTETISTGILGLDIALGIGGLPKGRIVEIYGPEASGKTTIALHVIAEAQKKGGKCLFVDAEQSFNEVYAQSIGVKLDEMQLCQPDYGEQALEAADRGIMTGFYAVVVIDSVAALTPKGELEGQMGDGKMGLHARLMSQACRKMVASISRTDTICIFINQLREKIGVMWGNPETTTGGNALKFYASVRLDVRATAAIKDGEVLIGRKTKVRVAKNKCAPPFQSTEFDFYFGEGIDQIGQIVDISAEMGVIQRNSAWYSYNGDKLGQGRDAVISLLKDNPPLRQEIEDKIKKAP